jgi:hypothetical protein
MHGETRLALYAVVGVLVVAMMYLRMRRMARVRPLRLEWLWVIPAVLILGLAGMIYGAPPQGLGWLWIGLAAAAGGALGWLRGSTMAITVDPETHALNMKASPAAIVFLVALFGLRTVLRNLLAENAGALHLGAALITDIPLAFAAGLLTVQRIEMALRARRLLAAARDAVA